MMRAEAPPLTTTWNAAWLTGSRITTDLLSFLLFIAISRYFGPGEIGAYSYGFAIAGFVSVIGGLGVDDYGVREYSRSPGGARDPLLSSLLGTQGLMMAVAVIGLILFLVITRPTYATAGIIVLLSVYQLAFTLAHTLFIPAFARQAMASPALAVLACRGGAIIMALLLMVGANCSLLVALTGFPVFGLFLMTVAVISAMKHDGSLSVHTTWLSVAGTARAIWPFVASEIVSHMYARADFVILSLIVSETAAGIYATGFKFVEVGIMPLIFLGVAAYPRLSHLFQPNSRRFQDAAIDFLCANLFLGGLLAWTLYFLVPLVLVPLLGAKFAAAAPIVRTMAGLALLQAVEIILVRVLLAAHLQLLRFKFVLVGTVLNVALNLVLIPLFEITGAVAASIITLTIINVLYAVALCNHLTSQILLRTFSAFAAVLASAIGAGVLTASLSAKGWLPAVASLVTFLLVAVVTGLVSPLWPGATLGRQPFGFKRTVKQDEP